MEDLLNKAFWLITTLAFVIFLCALALALIAPHIQEAFHFENVRLAHGEGLEHPKLTLDPPETVVWVKTSDGVILHGWDIPPQADAKPLGNLQAHTVLFFHGNSRNLQAYIPHIGRTLREGYRVVAFDYRGFGLSTGSPTEEGFYKDVDAIVDYVVKTTPGGKAHVVLHGYSIGCAAATKAAAAKDDYAAVVLEAPFDDFKAAALTYLPLLAPLAPFITPTFPNAKRIKNLTRTPLLVVHSRGDEVVHFASGVKVFDTAKSKHKHFIESPGGHYGVHCDDRAYRWLADTLEETANPRSVSRPRPRKGTL